MGRQPPRPAGDAPAAVPSDYDADPQRYRLGMEVTGAYATGSLYDRVGRMLRALRVDSLLDVGCADGVLRHAVSPSGSWTVGLDASATLLRNHPPPVVRADAVRLPFVDGTFDAVTALNVLYHLRTPVIALRKARRVLREGGHLLVATIAGDDSPELAAHWRRPATTFDAEDAPDLLAQVFAHVEKYPWDARLVTLPTADAIRDYLLGRQTPAAAAEAAARALPVPLQVTKRRALLVAH
jgi:SAM-dependent methyltransferase